MKKIILGGLAVLIGVSGFSNFFFTFLGIIAGGLPLLLILGGALAFYLGYTEIQAEKEENTQSFAIPDKEPVREVEKPVVETAPKKEPLQDISKDPDGSGAAEKPTEDVIPEKPASTPDTPAFKGNAETLVFHAIDCKFSQGKKCTVEFATREEAVAQGYKPCKVCKA